MVATGAAFALEHGGAAEFAAPDDEGIFEEAALFKVGEEGVSGLVGVLATDFHIFVQVAVVIPAAVVELDEAGAFFR